MSNLVNKLERAKMYGFSEGKTVSQIVDVYSGNEKAIAIIVAGQVWNSALEYARTLACKEEPEKIMLDK